MGRNSYGNFNSRHVFYFPIHKKMNSLVRHGLLWQASEAVYF